MNELLNKLFGLEGLGFGSPGTGLSFLHAFGSWVWALLLVALCVLSWWSYRGLAGSKRTHGLLIAFRTLLLFSVFTLAAGPMLERVTMHTERDAVLVLLDRSGSLGTPDANSASRDDQMLTMLAENSEEWNALSESKSVSWFGFNDRSNKIAAGVTPTTLPQIGGKGSNISAAIREALKAHAGEPISAIVLVSDGRSTDALDPELVSQLTNARIAVHTVPLGSPDPVRDVLITRVQSPDLVFADDRAPIRVDLAWSGINANTAQAALELIDHATGQILQSIPIDPQDFSNDNTHQYTLHHALSVPGDTQLDIVVNTASTTDMNPDNNTSTVTMHAVDRPLRVLYIDGYPRWDQRYLKALLTREDSIAGTVMLLAADRHYVQDGDVLIDRVPTTKEQWEQYDVVILGDVRAELFTPTQLEGLNQHIADHGAGLLWIGGPSATPSTWLNSPIAGLLPMRAPDVQQSALSIWEQPITMRSTPEADRLGILQLAETGWSERLSDPATGWSQLRLVQRINPQTLKPGVAVLANANPIDGSADQTPLVMTMRYAGGRVGYVATDEIWRWRYGRGEALPERFWLPMIRMLARGTVARGSTPALLRIAPTSPEPGKPVQLTLELLDQSLIETLPASTHAQIAHSGSREQPVSVALAGAGNMRIGSWIPTEPGRYEISLGSADPLLASVSGQITVLNSTDERRTLDTDHALLEQLAAQTAGKLVMPSEFATIPDLLPNRARTTALPPEQISLWDRPIILIVLILLLTIEWITRKALRLA